MFKMSIAHMAVCAFFLGTTALRAMDLGDESSLENPKKRKEGKFSEKTSTPKRAKIDEEEGPFSFLIENMQVLIMKKLDLASFSALSQTSKKLNLTASDPIFYLPEDPNELINKLKTFISSKGRKIDFEGVLPFIERSLKASETLFKAGMLYFKGSQKEKRNKLFFLTKKRPTLDLTNLDEKLRAWQPHGLAFALAEALWHDKATKIRRKIKMYYELFLRDNDPLLHLIPEACELDKTRVYPLETYALRYRFLELNQELISGEIRKLKFLKIPLSQLYYEYYLSDYLFPGYQNSCDYLVDMIAHHETDIPKNKEGLFYFQEKYMYSAQKRIERARRLIQQKKAEPISLDIPDYKGNMEELQKGVQKFQDLIYLNKTRKDIEDGLRDFCITQAKKYDEMANSFDDKEEKREFFLKAANLYEMVGEKIGAARSYFKAANFSDDNGKKREFLLKAAIFFEAVDQKLWAAGSYFNAANLSDDREEKRAFFLKAGSLFETVDDKLYAAKSYYNGAFFSDDIQEQKTNYLKAAALYKAVGEKLWATKSCCNAAILSDTIKLRLLPRLSKSRLLEK